MTFLPLAGCVVIAVVADLSADKKGYYPTIANKWATTNSSRKSGYDTATWRGRKGLTWEER